MMGASSFDSPRLSTRRPDMPGQKHHPGPVAYSGCSWEVNAESSNHGASLVGGGGNPKRKKTPPKKARIRSHRLCMGGFAS